MGTILSDPEQKTSKKKKVWSYTTIPEELSKQFVVNYNQNPLADRQIEQKIQYLIDPSWKSGTEMSNV